MALSIVLVPAAITAIPFNGFSTTRAKGFNIGLGRKRCATISFQPWFASIRSQGQRSIASLIVVDCRLNAIVEHNLTGDVLCMIRPENLKEIGVATVGQRLAILKAIYLIKLAHEIPFEPDHYIPPC